MERAVCELTQNAEPAGDRRGTTRGAARGGVGYRDEMPTFGVLGALRVVGDDGTEIPLTGGRQRRLLSALLLHRGRVVSADRLGELVWDLDTMVDPAALQSLVFRLRQRVPTLDV